MATSIINEIGKDFGGYWDVGTLGTLGSQMNATVGKAYGAWVRTYDTTVSPLMLTWFGVSVMPNSYNMFMLNTTWTTDYAPLANNILIDVQGTSGVGWAFWMDLGTSPVNFNDGNYHHHFVSFSGLTGGKPDILKYYVDGNEYDLRSANDISDPGGLTGSCSDFTLPSYIGCDGKTDAMTPIDMSTLDVEDLRIYDRFLSFEEVNQIYKLRGRDMIRRGLHTRHPFFVDGKDIGYNGYIALPHNNGGGSSDPTILTVKATAGTRRKVM